MTRFSSFAQTLQASDIAELLALTEKPEVISLPAACLLRNYFRLKK